MRDMQHIAKKGWGAWRAAGNWGMKRAVTPEQRLEAFRKMVEQRPEEPFARYSLAMSCRSLGRAAEAALEFQELLRRTPDYVPAYLMLGQVLEGLGRAAEAAQVYRSGIAAATRKNESHARNELGQALEVLEGQGVR
jgi:tetratricopeptide (TPR) repeat protein